MSTLINYDRDFIKRSVTGVHVRTRIFLTSLFVSQRKLVYENLLCILYIYIYMYMYMYLYVCIGKGSENVSMKRSMNIFLSRHFQWSFSLVSHMMYDKSHSVVIFMLNTIIQPRPKFLSSYIIFGCRHKICLSAKFYVSITDNDVSTK